MCISREGQQRVARSRTRNEGGEDYKRMARPRLHLSLGHAQTNNRITLLACIVRQNIKSA